MRATCSTGLVLAIAVHAAAEGPKSAPARQQAIEQALETFAGTWEITASQPEGITKEARRLVFRKDLTYSALDGSDQELWSGTFEIDPSANPKVWDHRSRGARQEGGDALGIYELNGDSLKVACVVGRWQDRQWVGKPRTQQFQLPAADVVLELRRVTPQ